MASWLPSSIQKRLLRYAINYVGILDDQAIDLDNLDISWGRRSTVEFRNVGLNVERISALASLPPNVRLETAKILLLRATLPANLSGIVVEADGIQLVAWLEEEQGRSRRQSEGYARTPGSSQSPSHRKTARRLRSPLRGTTDGSRVPTAADLARSFLAEEPIEERRELEATVAANARDLEQSVASESSDGSCVDTGTGAGPGLPLFLANYLQGIMDSFEASIKNIQVILRTAAPGNDATVGLALNIESVHVPPKALDRQAREINVEAISVDLHANREMLSELSQLPSPASPVASRSPDLPRQSTSSPEIPRADTGELSAAASLMYRSTGGDGASGDHQGPVRGMQASSTSDDLDRFADADPGEDEEPLAQSGSSGLGIQPGDDNISWTSRRSHSDVPADDLWGAQSHEDLPDSLLIGTGRSIPASRSSKDSSRHSGTSERSRRAVSPYDRHLQSPGSWPQLERSPHSVRPSPGSWPAPDQIQHSFHQPLTPGPGPAQGDATDNKLNAFDAALRSSNELLQAEPSEESRTGADLTESRVFSHDEAESIYMSAMAQDPSTPMPGAWSVADAASGLFQTPDRRYSSDAGPPEAPDNTAALSQPKMPEEDQPPSKPPSETATPRAQSPSPTISSPESGNHQTVLQLLFIDTVSATIPLLRSESVVPAPKQEAYRHDAPTMSRVGMPGTFSAYSEMTSSRRKGISFSSGHGGESVAGNRLSSREETKASSSLEVKLGTLRMQLDVATAQLLYQVGSGLVLHSNETPTSSARVQSVQDPGTGTPSVDMTMEMVQICLKERATSSIAQPPGSDETALACINCNALEFGKRYGRTEARIRTFDLSIGRSKLLAFDQDPRSMTSSVISQEDIAVVFDNSRTSLQGRALKEIDVHTRPLLVNIDLPAIDETLGTFGGLSTVLDIGSSILSDASPLASPVVAARPTKVRFHDEAAPVKSSTELKANVRVGGATVHLRGRESILAMKMSTVKSIYRENGATVSIGHLRLSGPIPSHGTEPPAVVDLSTVRLDYLFTPQEQDFERLLALLVPSRDKYDSDEDILIDTLLRQRRKGACLRLTVDDVKANIVDWDCLTTLDSLASEISRFAAVAKYLPEDDRPGLLSMIRVKGFEAQFPVNERFGKLRASLKEFQCAHVGLPALLALSLSNVALSQLNGPDIVHPLIPLSGIDNLPMVMARMLGDEAEPTVKVKLFNVCVEYSVPILLDLTGMDKVVDTEDLVAGLAASVAELALRSPKDEQPHRVDSDKSASAKKTNLKLLLHNSAIGLTPQTGSGKGLLILTDARFSALIPPDETTSAKVELRQAGIVITDDALAPSEDIATVRRNPPENTKVDTRLLNALWKQGYASVGSIMNAVVDTRIEKQPQSDDRAVQVDARSEFFLLETCADSTQTLIGIMNGLAPPTPPSKQPKYLTEPMSLDDMISSFTGDAFTQPEPKKPSETLFDVEEEDAESMLNASLMNDAADNLLAESEMTSSLYGPTSGLIGDIDDDQNDDRDFGEAVESLLEDDPFEMTDSPDDMPFSDATLLKDLRQQSMPAKSDSPVDLGNYEIEDLGFDALGAGQQALGSANRFNTPISRRHIGKGNSQARIPFKLNLRDVNIAWHLHDGYDWQKTRDGLTAAVEQVERRAEERMARRRQSRNEYEEEESTIGDCMFNSVYISIPTNVAEAQDIRRGINRQIDDMVSESESVPASGMSRPTTYSAGGRPVRQNHRRRLKLERSRHQKISFELKGVSADVLVFPPDTGEVQSSIDVRLKHFEIVDLVPSSTWKKFLTSMPGEAGTREMSKPMFHIEMLNVRTIADHAATEITLHVAVEPLRLHVDQDALDFITRFFEFKDSNAVQPPPPSEQPFLQRVEVETVDLQLDYKPKKVDYVGLRSGHTSEFMNFVILDQANIRLRHAIIYGLHGFEPLHKTLNDIWAPDVTRNQLPTVLAGLAPVRSLVNIGTSVRDVVAIPVREYKKDGRIVRSIQKGAFQFGKTTASELARLGAKVAIGTQNLLSGAEGMLSPSTASPSGQYLSSSPDWADDNPEAEEREKRAFSAYADQPLGVLAGLRSARRHLEHDLLTARDAFIAVQGEVLESGGPGSAAKAVARHAPTVILRPVIGASRAVGTALLGVGNQIDRGGVRRMEDKYKRR